MNVSKSRSIRRICSIQPPITGLPNWSMNAFDLLGEDVCYAHCKDVLWEPEMLPSFSWVVAGTGGMDFEQYLVRLSRMKSTRPFFLEFLPEDKVSRSKENILRRLRKKSELKFTNNTKNYERDRMKTYLSRRKALAAGYDCHRFNAGRRVHRTKKHAVTGNQLKIPIRRS